MTELVDIFNTTSNQDGDSRYLNKKKYFFFLSIAKTGASFEIILNLYFVHIALTSFNQGDLSIK